VRSIVGRYLEHSRAFAFHNDGDPAVFIGSADMMHRNLDRRVEALVRLVAPDHINEVQEMFDLAMADTASSWHLESDGEWTRHSTDDAGRPLEDVQNVTMRKISARKRSTR
jgi:polyphosphate kinase